MRKTIMMVAFIAVMLMVAIAPIAFAEEQSGNENDDSEAGDAEDSSETADVNTTETSDDDSGKEDESETEDTTETSEEELTETEVDEETSDEETEEEAKMIVSQEGAKVRLLQLEKAITRNILHGNEVIASITEKSATAETAELEAIIAQLEVLKSEVVAIDPADAGEETAQKFVEIKKDAIELSQEFRKKARELVKAEDLPKLKARLDAKDKERLKEMREKIKESKKDFNAAKVQAAFGALGIRNPELLAKVENGEATLKEVREYLKESFKELSKDKKRDAVKKMRETISKDAVFKRAVSDKARLNYLERKQSRLENRLEKAERLDIDEDAKEKLRERISAIGEKIENADARIEKRQEIIAAAESDD